MSGPIYIAFCIGLGVILCFGLWMLAFSRDFLVHFGFEVSEYQPTGFLYFLYFGAIVSGCCCLLFVSTKSSIFLLLNLESSLEMYTGYAMAVIVYQPMDYIWQNFELKHLDEAPSFSWVSAGVCFWWATLFALPGTMMDGDDPSLRPFGVVFYLTWTVIFMIYALRKIRAQKKT
jgi:hypothetical protein